GDMDSETAIRPARDGPIQEYRPLTLLADLHAIAFDRCMLLLKRRELVIMGGEDDTAARARRLNDVFQDGTSEGHAIKCAGAAPNFVQKRQTPRGGVAEKCGGLFHFDHEGAAAGREVLTGAGP